MRNRRFSPLTAVAAALVATLLATVSATVSVAPVQAAPASAPIAALDGDLRHGPDSHSLARLYHAYFLRAPEAEGLAYWQGVARSGVSLSHISLEFSRSREFRAKYGDLNDADFVRLVYRNVMDREPDQGGFDHWTRLLAERRLSRGGVMIGFSDSPEFKSKTGLFDPPAPVAVPGSFIFLDVDQYGRPTRWNPCAPIDVVINASVKPEIRPIIVHALTVMSEGTGVHWRLIGDTTEQVRVAINGVVSDRNHHDLVSRYGQRWAPVLLTIPEVYDHSATAGLGGPLIVGNRHGQWLSVSGVAVLNRHFLSRPDTTNEDILHLIIHELGHVFGLDHTEVRGEVMSTGDTWLPNWGPGDRAGFRALTDGGCIEVPPLFAAWRGHKVLVAG